MGRKKTELRQRPTIALALGGGGARGLAHVAMLEVFDELSIRPSLIAGTSIGALYGAAYASGLSAHHIRVHTEEVLGQRVDLLRRLISARAEPVSRLFNVLPMRTALLDPVALLELLLPMRVAKTFEQLVIPLQVVATDFHAQAPRVFAEGPLRTAVAASIALPALFQPVKYGDAVLVDGGLVDPLPLDLITGKADITIAIDVAGAPPHEPASTPPTAFEALLAASQILQRSIVREMLKSMQPDIYIEVEVGEFHVLEFYRHKDILAAAEPAKQRLKARLQRILATETLAPVAVADETRRHQPAASRGNDATSIIERAAARIGDRRRRRKPPE